MKSNLVIVESPAKAKTIQGYLGKDYEVTSSFGHIRDLPKKKMAVDIEGDFTPEYEISGEKKKRVAELKKQVGPETVVWLATDEDREGEAIAWHLSQALKLKDSKLKRIVFHEITKQAIEAAVSSPRGIDQKLVDAQQARRVLDRLVGYELSPLLWRKVRPGLSAGRVQSVAVRLIVEREREIEAFEPKRSFKLNAELEIKDSELSAQYPQEVTDEKEARKLLETLAKAKLQVKSLDQADGTRNPSAPFTTSTLQQEAARRLGFSVKQTMTLAQRLYESGAITYMRTDSLALSDQARKQAGDYINKTYGAEYHQTRTFKTKTKGAQEAHEAIRPTDAKREQAGEDERTKKLYQLIRGRFLASQMAPAKLKRTTARIGNDEIELEVKGEVITFDGWLKAYPQSNIKDNALPSIQVGDPAKLKGAQALETLSRGPARYSEATLVKRLEEMGIGRPSTYAPTISTIQDRGYIEKREAPSKEHELTVLELDDGGKVSKRMEAKQVGGEKGKLLPTDTAIVVTDFLVKHFPDVVDYDFTASVEEEFDAIADGERKWNAMIKEFYNDFHETVEQAKQVSRKEASQARELGTDPDTGRPVSARYGRYGPMIQIGNREDEEKPKFAPLPPGTTLDSVTLEAALKMFELPRELGKDKDGNIIKANIGRYGPYVQQERTFASIPEGEDAFSISLERALELLAEKVNQKQRQLVAEFEGGIQVKRGRYGPYVTDGKLNAKIPKSMDAEKISAEEANELLQKKAQAS